MSKNKHTDRTVATVGDATVTTPDAATIARVTDAVPVPASIAAPLTLTDVTELPAGYTVPAFVVAFRDAFRAIHGMPVTTRDERIIAFYAFRAAVESAMPGQPVPTGKHTGRFTGMPVFESQNTLYVCAVLANVPLADGHIMVAWRAELPNAKCDYLAKNYAWSTLSEYVNGRHNGSTVPGGVSVVIDWAKRGRRPLTIGA